MYVIICHMKRTTIFLDEAVENDLKALANTADVPVASLVREALAEYVARRQESASLSVRFLAAGRSASRDVAERNEELVFAGLEPHGRPRPVAVRRRSKR